MLRRLSLTSLLGFMLMFAASSARAQYQVTVLDSNQEGQATHPPDPLLVNGWGLTRGPSTPWWVADNLSGWSTLYDGSGVKQGLDVEIPPAPSGGPVGLPTGAVWNPSTNFADFKVNGKPAPFIFDTLDGTISAWAPSITTFDTNIVVDNSSKNASYTALAVTNKPSGNFLFAADTNNNEVGIYDGTFTWKGNFQPDPAIPSGFSVFGIRDIDGLVFVSFASSSGGTGGFIDVYSEGGILLRSSFIHGAPLNQPWGFAAAAPSFGPLSNTLLISNNTNTGTINAFNALTGQFIGTMKDTAGNVIHINQLWAIDFGGGVAASGPKNTMYFTAGPDNNLAGEFGKIVFK